MHVLAVVVGAKDGARQAIANRAEPNRQRQPGRLARRQIGIEAVDPFVIRHAISQEKSRLRYEERLGNWQRADMRRNCEESANDKYNHGSHESHRWENARL